MSRLSLSALIAAFVLTSSAAYAQATINGHPSDFDQYPSFLQVSVHMQNGIETVLRCGYSLNGGAIVADPSYMESSVINVGANSYARYQRIDNKVVITAPAPGIAGRYILQATEPNGTTFAKSCQLDLNSDTIQGCIAAQAFIPATEASKQDQGAAQQCGALFAKATPQMNAADFNLQKTEQFKAALRQKVAIIEAP
jgi:hypothetical protein